MASFIPNQPVAFLSSPICGCDEKEYCQPILPTDITRFQLPNECFLAASAFTLTDSDFSADANLDNWSQDDSNGGANAWTLTGSPQRAKAAALSKILKQTVTIPAYNLYTVTLTFSSGAGCTVVIVAYRADGSYVVIGELSSTGTLSFTPSEDFYGIGFYTTGSCGETLTAVQSISMTTSSGGYEPCVSVTVKDKDDAVVGSGSVTAYDGTLICEVDWSTIALVPGGCYRICIVSDHFFGDNIFPDGDRGTFETAMDGITSAALTHALSSDRAFEGSKSLKITFNIPPVSAMASTTPVRLKTNTLYTINAWIYGDSAPVDAYFKLRWTSSYGTVHDVRLDYADASEQWAKLSLSFTTGSTGADAIGTFSIIIDTDTPWGIISPDIPVYIDAISLYETEGYSVCSEPFCVPKGNECTLLFEYRNDEPGFGFIYPAGFSFAMRLSATLEKPKYPAEEEKYDYSDGERKALYASSRKTQQLIIKDAPEYIHDCLRLALLHDHFSIDGIEYLPENPDYQPGWRKQTNVAEAQVEVGRASQDTRNNYL